MKLQAAVDGEKHEIEITHDGSRLSARVDRRLYELEASEPEPNVYLLKHEGRIFEVFVSPQKNSTAPFAAHIGSAEIEVAITDPKRLRGKAAGTDAVDGKAEIRTAMPGKVVRILVTQGAEVRKGDGVMVVEAMKMQNEMKSPKDGTVTAIRVNEGDNVGAGDILLVVE
jgi:biotin carboxyl carrier protein